MKILEILGSMILIMLGVLAIFISACSLIQQDIKFSNINIILLLVLLFCGLQIIILGIKSWKT